MDTTFINLTSGMTVEYVELHKITMPARIVWGDQGGLTLRSEQDALVKAIPGARLVVFERRLRLRTSSKKCSRRTDRWLFSHKKPER